MNLMNIVMKKKIARMELKIPPTNESAASNL